MSSLRDYAYEPTYDASTNKYCDGYIEIPFHPDAGVREHGCHQKCTADPSHPDCARSKSDKWSSGSNYLCVDLATAQAICTGMDDCVGVTWGKQTSTALLSTHSCAMKISSGFNFYAKSIPETPSCALGLGREIKSTSHNHPEVEGLYELDEDGDSYTQVQPAYNSQIVWDAGHCGWIVQADLSAVPPQHRRLSSDKCEDRNDAANAAFQNTADTSDPDLCHSAANVWGDGSYCENSIFAAMCAKSCHQTCGDNNAAASEYSQMIGGGESSCVALAAMDGCSDIVVSALCRDTCGDRRWSHAAAAMQKSALGSSFRRLMSNLRLDRIAKKLKPATSAREQHRRLNMNGEFEELYHTFQHGAAACTTGPDHTLLEIDGTHHFLYDIKNWDTATPQSLSLSCPSQRRYMVKAGDNELFCRRQNIAVPYNSEPLVVNNGCFRKCTLLKNSSTTNAVSDDGTNDWCGGNSEDFNEMTNALCLPREDCETLCDELEDCYSFDMHKSLPRCYLNLGEQCAETEVNADYDIITRVDTPDETTEAVQDTARNTYTTYTGASFSGDFEGTTQTTNDPQDCRASCDSDPNCYGFTWVSLLTTCTFYDSGTVPPMDEMGAPMLGGWLSTPAAQSITSVVWKVPYAPCTITVSGESRPEEALFLGEYAERQDLKGTFVRGDNKTRVRNSNEVYCEAGATRPGWVLEENTMPLTEVTLYNCSDFPDAANVFLEQTQFYTTTVPPTPGPTPGPTSPPTDPPTPAPTAPTPGPTPAPTLNVTAGETAAPTPSPTPVPSQGPTPNPTMSPTPSPTIAPTDIPFMGAKEHSCQWGANDGWCEKSAVFAGVCAHTCAALKHVSYPDEHGRPTGYTYQTETADADDFACHGDNDAAMPEIAAMYGIGGDVSTCLAVAEGNWYNYTHAPCQYGDLAELMHALCKTTCMNVAPVYEPEVMVQVTDESDPAGALYGQRLLDANRRLQHERRLSGYTTSYGGRPDNMLSLFYLDGHADDAYWGFRQQDVLLPAAFRSWSSSFLAAGEQCRASSSGASSPAQHAYDAVGLVSLYAWDTPTDPGTNVLDVCREAPHCPELTVCAMSANRFSDEIDSFRNPTNGNPAEAGVLGRNEFVSDLSAADRAHVLEGFSPKTITTDTRAEAYIVGVKADFAGEVYRTVPGATRVKFAAGAAIGDKAIVSLAPATAGDGVYSLAELGREYPHSEFWNDWTTDVVRIERFGADGAAMEGPVSFMLWEPAPALTVFMFDKASNSDGVNIATVGGSVEGGANGWWTVTVPRANADFVGTTDRDECVDSPCDNNAVCTNRVGKEPECSCNHGYVGSGKAGECALKPDAYDSADQSYYFRLQHTDRLDYGWRIKSIKMYSDAACSKAISTAAMLPLPGPGGCGVGDAPDCTDETFNDITKTTKVYTGEKAYSSYPGNYDNGHLFDSSTSTEWWSSGLNLNPEKADKTHRGAQTIDWAVSGSYTVQCVKVEQVENHLSENLVLTRGPLSVPNSNCGIAPDQELCEASMTWTSESVGSGHTAKQFTTQCGEANTQYFGEILVLESTTDGGWYGSYPDQIGVPSACHCHALCVAHIEEGCRSYKYYDQGGVQHCYLQSNLFSAGEGYWGTPKNDNWPGWRSGTPGRRTTGFSPSKQRNEYVIPGEEFMLTISGVGLPYSADDNYNTAPRQRVKIMEQSQDCKDKPPAEIYGIGCSETVRKVNTSYGIRQETVYTICSPKPMAADPDAASFGPISITASSEAKTYKVCYCDAKCYEPSSYRVVPGTIEMASSTFVWAVTPEVVTRKVSGGAAIELRVARPSFGSYSSAAHWELKVVRDYFGCSVQADSAKFQCVESRRPAVATDTNSPYLLLPNYEPPVVNETYDLWPNDEMFVLEFDEDVTMADCTGSFHLVAESGTTSVQCADAIVDTDRVYLNFGSGSVGDAFSVKVDAGAVRDLSGNPAAAAEWPAAGGKYLFNASDAAADLVFSKPADGSNLAGNEIKLYLTKQIDAVSNITLHDCGVDNVCDAGDRALSNFTFDVGSPSNTVDVAINEAMVYGRRYRLTMDVDAFDGAGPLTARFVEFVYGCGAASYVDSPDSAVWKFDLDLGVADAGSYTVCFREPGGDFAPIPAADSKYLQIEKLEADRTHPRGIFHNQFFSALSGSGKALNVSVAGTRVPVPSDSKVVISRGKSCGIADFDGVNVRPAARQDAVKPTLDAFEPANGATVDGAHSIVLQFSEAMKHGPDCFSTVNGSAPTISFTDKDNSNNEVSFTCNNVLVDRNRVILNPADGATSGDTLTSGTTYYVQVMVDALTDLAGNSPAFIITQGYYEVTATSQSGDVAPEVVTTRPANDMEGPTIDYVPKLDDQGADTGETVAVGTVTLQLSAPANPGSTADVGRIVLVDCGADHVCNTDDDDKVNEFESSALSYGSDDFDHYAIVPVGVSLRNGRRFEMSIPADFFDSSGSTNTPGPSQPYVFEFVKNTANYDYFDMVMSSSDLSTEDSLVFGMQLYGSMHPQESFTLCYCNDQNDETLADLGDGETTYKLQEDARCDDALAGGLAATLKDRSIAEHACDRKCSTGCTGPFCYCDGYVAGGADQLCLPPSLCREACDLAGDACGGISVHDSLPQCTLVPAASMCFGNSSATFVVDEESQLFRKHSGTACTNLADFAERAGSLFITSRVEVAVDYVLHPGQKGSIEVTAPERFVDENDPPPSWSDHNASDLTYEHDAVYNFLSTKLLSRDRITVIDCKGTCGVSSPTSAIVLPENGDKISTWNDFVPHTWFVDYPHVDDQNEIDPDKTMTYAMPKAASSDGFTVQTGEFCPRANINLETAKVSFDGTLQSLKSHQCYSKCSLNAPCVGDECFCDGHYSGYDSLESNALCASAALCEYMCNQLDDCTSIDMHAELPRCFLNLRSECQGNTNTEAEMDGFDENYNLHMKSGDPNDSNFGGRRAAAQERSLLPATDFGFSWESMLRFHPLEFKSGGTFKLCFCDSSITAGAQRGSSDREGPCRTEKDYKIEVGTIHASGVSCLIANPQLQRVSCATQFHGGLRCYRHMDAPEPALPVIGMTDFSVDPTAAGYKYNTKCLYMPQEQADKDPDCQGVAAYHGTLGSRRV